MKRFISLFLILLFSLFPLLCSCEYVYELELERKEQQKQKEQLSLVASEVEARPLLDTPKKDPESLENYSALLEAAKEFKETGSVSLRHYLISHTVGTERIKEMVQQGYNLTALNFKSSDAFFDTCLFYLLLEDSFGKDLSEFSKKTAALTEDQRAIFVEERLQMLTFLATKAKNADPEAPFAAYALYSIKGALLKNREVFHCYDLLCRTALNESYPISYVSTATDPISKERWEITKRCYDAYTAGTLSAKETLALLVRERQNIKDHVDPYGFLKYEPYC